MTKAPRNKTLSTGLEDGKPYLERCVSENHLPLPLSGLVNKTINGDSFRVLPMLPENSVDLIIADPPYNLKKNYNGKTFSKLSSSDYSDFTGRWLDAVEPLLKPTGSIYVCCDWQSSIIIGKALESRFKIRNRITWQREKGRGAKANWKNCLEDIWFATKGNEYTFNLDSVKVRKRVLAPYKSDGQPKDWAETQAGKFRDTCPSNFWDDITIPFWSMPENTDHPTQKPEKLMAKIILASSDPGDLILDPFSGSGTALVTAKKLERHYIGIETDPLYCIWTEQRLEMADSDSSIQGYKDGVFWERNSRISRK